MFYKSLFGKKLLLINKFKKYYFVHPKILSYLDFFLMHKNNNSCYLIILKFPRGKSTSVWIGSGYTILNPH